ncbi:MAG TPA: hypothetical protein VHS59_02570, partial [Bacillota bacterium]|nr:hypothetical protein [Bacillota bacterium]
PKVQTDMLKSYSIAKGRLAVIYPVSPKLLTPLPQKATQVERVWDKLLAPFSAYPCESRQPKTRELPTIPLIRYGF